LCKGTTDEKGLRLDYKNLASNNKVIYLGI